MSVLYRAVWSDAPSADNLEKIRYCVAAWAQESSEPTPLVQGQTELDLSQGRHRRIDYRAITPDAFEFTASDQKPGDATVWTTIVRVVADDTGIHTLVENRMESDDFTLRVSVGRPKVVHELLDVATRVAR